MLRDVRYALRRLRESPGFSLTAILTLALSIGATTAMFAVLDAVLLQPLPFPEPDRLVAVASQPDAVISIPTMQDYASRSATFTSLAAYREWSPSQKTHNAPAARRILVVTQGFFATLEARFALGRSWPVTGNEQDCSSQAIVSAGYWTRLNADSLENKTLNLDGRDFEIAGVLAADQDIEGSYALNQPEVFVQVGCDREARPNARGDNDFGVIGRLRSGVTLAQANADLVRVDRDLQKDYPNYYGAANAVDRKPTLVYPYIELLVGTDTKPALLMVFGACGLLLAIACANLASLILVRNTRRRMEFATRATLGATASQLLRQLMVESALLVSTGTVAGIVLAAVLIKIIKSTTAIHLPRLSHASMHLSVLLFVVVVSAAVTVFLAISPAWRALRPGLLQDLQGTGSTSAGKGVRFARRSFVLAQLSLSVVLVACAGWMIGGVYLLLHQPLGFDPDHLLMIEVELGSDHPSIAETRQSELEFSEIAASLRNMPGIASAAVTDHPPLGHAIDRYNFCSDRHPEECKQQVHTNPNSYDVSPGYFSTIGQALLQGRDFNDADDGRNNVAIVNEALAAREWPGESPLGHRVHSGELHAPQGQGWATVVGVVASVHNYDLVSQPGPDLYLPRSEHPRNFARIIVQTRADPALLKNAIRSEMKKEFPEARIFGFETIPEEMSFEVSQRVFLMQIAIAFGAVALFQSILGTYGLLGYEVSLRVKEIGIRMALGSSRQRILKLLMYEHGRLLIGGTTLGLACAIAVGYALRSQFYGVRSTSFLVLIGAALMLAFPALLATAIPARRASLQDPADTLRRE
ncbi:MAG TPA: ADOP family duplicated permease [Candidatus Sulfotelmatobacter sp.]|nr:ADOP family duplicated permease [Candidatus Sulfotelmatobacter sp.]